MQGLAAKAFVLALAGEAGSLLAAYLKFGVALEVWALALGLLALGLLLSALVPLLKGLRWPLAFGTLFVLGGAATQLVYLA